jgi:hypothetical protein
MEFVLRISLNKSPQWLSIPLRTAIPLSASYSPNENL